MKLIKENFDKSVEKERELSDIANKKLEEEDSEKKIEFGKKDSVRKWYEYTFPEDAVSVEDMNPDITFEKAATYITPHNGEDRFYDRMNIGDSFVREMIFEKIASLYGVDYDDVYETWMGKPFTKLKDKLAEDGVHYSLDESTDTEKVKDILSGRLTKDGKGIRAFSDDEKMPKGFKFKSGVGSHGEVSYLGTDYAYAVVDGVVRVMTDKDAGWNWSETLYNDKLFESTQDSVFKVTYKASDKILSSFMVVASNKDEAIDKAMKYRDKKYGEATDIVGATKVTKDEIEDYKRRGMSLIESDCNSDIDEKLSEDRMKDIETAVTKLYKLGADLEAIKKVASLSGELPKEDVDYIDKVYTKLSTKISEGIDNIEVSVDETEDVPESPKTDTGMAIANMLNLLIQDEWQAIDGYNGTISTLRSIKDDSIDTDKNIDYEGMIKILEDISAEENNHIGMLQKALSTVSPNVSEISGGEEEASETLSDTQGASE